MNTKHTNSVETAVHNIVAHILGTTNWEADTTFIENEIHATLKATHQQQVEEAVLQADATGAYHSGYLAGKAEVEEAVRAERSRIYGRLTQMKSVYETMDTGSALIQLMGEDVIREKTPNHQD